MTDLVETVRTVRQIRQYAPDPVPDHVLRRVLDVARWTGSSKNEQPWHFVVVTDRDALGRLAALRPNIAWIVNAPLGIAIVLDDAGTTGAYDEGRVTERILVAAHSLGYGGGVAWFGDPSQQAEAKRVLGIPEDRTARSIVMLGRATSREDPRPMRRVRGRKPLSEIVGYGRWGQAKT